MYGASTPPPYLAVGRESRGSMSVEEVDLLGAIYVDSVDRVYGGCEKSSIREEKKKNIKKNII